MNKFCKKVLGSLAILIVLTGTSGAADASGVFNGAQRVSWYGPGFHGKRAADGSIFNQNAMTTAASSKYKMGSRLLVTNAQNGKSVVVKVTDRGGFAKYGRALDMSKASFARIAGTGQGTCKVHIKKL